MATPKAAWGIEIGAHAIKAIRLERDGDSVSVSDFTVIPHKKVLTTPDLDRDEMVRLGLGQFISQKSLENEHLVMSVPGHSAFARFAKLPPVEPKKVPDIVKFEAVQQIPFPIDEVEWDYQTFTSADSPETEVGIFAITRERVQHLLHLYGELGVSPERLTLSPVAVYNAMAYDHSLADRSEPVMYLDIGTQATDVIIANEGRCWIRTFPLGGTHFTEAIASAFKLSYSKAEKLKLEAATSKYAKQIMQAMRPVFSDLLQDLQRSIGYYHSLHRDAELETVIGLGSTFKIPGLRKFIGQQLQVNVLRLDEYKKIQVTGREAASFAEHAVNFASAYGLALQGVGLAQIDANLVPVSSLREQLWRNKTKWFAAAAAIVIVGAGMTLYRPFADNTALEPSEPSSVSVVLNSSKRVKSQFDGIRANSPSAAAADNMRQLLDYRELWPHLLRDAGAALASTDPQPALLSGDPAAARSIDPDDNRLVELQSLNAAYSFNPQSKARRMLVTLDVQLSHRRPDEFLISTVARWLRDNADRPDVPYRIIPESVSINPERLQRLAIKDDGSTEVRGGPGAGTSASSSSSTGGFGSTPSGWSQPPTQQPPQPSYSGDGGMASGGGNRTRRTPGGDGTPRRAPGQGMAAGAGQQQTAPTPSPTYQPPSSSGQRPGQTAPTAVTASNLDDLAPMPVRPTVFSAGDTVYRVPITFEIEILDTRPAAAPNTAAAPATREVNS